MLSPAYDNQFGGYYSGTVEAGMPFNGDQACDSGGVVMQLERDRRLWASVDKLTQLGAN